MTTRDKFKRRVIELIHGLPYDKAEISEIAKISEIQRKEGLMITQKYLEDIKTFPITIGRVMQAVHKKHTYFNSLPNLLFAKAEEVDLLGIWKLTKENGQECTDDDQTDEIIEQLYSLIK